MGQISFTFNAIPCVCTLRYCKHVPFISRRHLQNDPFRILVKLQPFRLALPMKAGEGLQRLAGICFNHIVVVTFLLFNMMWFSSKWPRQLLAKPGWKVGDMRDINMNKNWVIFLIWTKKLTKIWRSRHYLLPCGRNAHVPICVCRFIPLW